MCSGSVELHDGGFAMKPTVGRTARVVLVSLYSAKYPSIGESHGLSVVAGAIRSRLGDRLESLKLIDKVATGVESCDDVVEAIQSVQANVVGIALQYGTFSVLEREYSSIKNALGMSPHLVVFGGALSTYLGDDILDLVDPEAVVIEGEGDQAFPAVVLDWLERGAPQGGANLRFRAGDNTYVGSRVLADLQSIAEPYRDHIGEIAASGGQIYVESSRGCSWAACTFCLRGLTDVRGRSDEYRRLPASRLSSDLLSLSRRGITAVTFADEDFMGGPLQELESYLDEVLKLLGGRVPKLAFDVSTTIDSILGSRDSADDAARRARLLNTLKAAGMRKVFLGIESGSRSQLRRYAKGHRPDECVEAVRRLRELGVALEIGFIMFDPLCTLDEISDNLEFLKSAKLVGAVSALTNEMRLQRGSTYVRLLEQAEERGKRQLFNRSIDRDTLSLRFSYADGTIDRMVANIRHTQRRASEMIYPLKSLTRYGERGAFGDSIDYWKGLLDRLRWAQFAGLEATVNNLRSGGGAMDLYGGHLIPVLEAVAEDVLNRLCSDDICELSHPAMRSVTQAARKAKSGYFREVVI